MTWSLTVPATDEAGLGDALDGAAKHYYGVLRDNDLEVDQAAGAQIDAALAAARDFAESGVVPFPVTMSISGHSNSGAVFSGTGNADSVTITVVSADPSSVQPPSEPNVTANQTNVRPATVAPQGTPAPADQPDATDDGASETDGALPDVESGKLVKSTAEVTPGGQTAIDAEAGAVQSAPTTDEGPAADHQPPFDFNTGSETGASSSTSSSPATQSDASETTLQPSSPTDTNDASSESSSASTSTPEQTPA